MPVLKNAKHELFAQELAKGKSEIEAYALAGYKRDDGNASRLTGYDSVKDRVAELLGKVAAKTEITIEGLIGEAAEIQRLAMKIEQPAAATGALTAKAKLAGLWIERSERTNRHVDPDFYTDAEVFEHLSNLGEDLALAIDPAPTPGKGKSH